MKQLRSIASLAIVLLAALPIQAQTENQAFYIYQNDGHFDGFFYDEIEKMTFSFLDTLGVEHDEIVSQEIITADSTYRIMLSAIDSIGFVQPEITYNPRLHNYQTDVLFNYLRNVSDDYRTFTFFDDLPSNMVPQVGDVFASFDIQSGFSCKVKEVNTIATGIIVQCGEIDDITDIFQHFVSVEEYGGDEQGNLVRRRIAGRPELNIDKSPRRAKGTWQGDIFNFSINGHIPLYASDDLNVTIDPSISGKVNVKTVWNLSLFGDKYISITTKLDFGVGCGFTVDGKIKDFFPSGVGQFTSIPVPATCPLLLIDITPDVFIRGEAHVALNVTSPKLNGGFWAKLEIKNWVPSIDMGWPGSGDEEENKFDPIDDNSAGATLSLNGFVQSGMLFPLNFKSLPLIKSFFDSTIGGNWYIGPKLAANFTLDLTTMPWNDVAAYKQLKNISASIHLLDADYEVSAKVKTAFSGEKKVTLADGSISLFPPFDASLMPEFGDFVDYEDMRMVGGELKRCRVLAFEPKGYVIKPVRIGVNAYNIKEDGSPKYGEYANVGYPIHNSRSYYHVAQILGQKMDKSMWPELVIPYIKGNYTGSHGKFKVGPVVVLNDEICYTDVLKEIELDSMCVFSGYKLLVNYDGTINTPITITGLGDSVEFRNSYRNPEYITILKSEGKMQITVDQSKMLEDRRGKYYNPCDTMTLSKNESCCVWLNNSSGNFIAAHGFNMDILWLPNKSETPQLYLSEDDGYHQISGVTVTLQANGWHVKTPEEEFDMIPNGNGFILKNGIGKTIKEYSTYTNEVEYTFDNIPVYRKYKNVEEPGFYHSDRQYVKARITTHYKDGTTTSNPDTGYFMNAHFFIFQEYIAAHPDKFK